MIQAGVVDQRDPDTVAAGLPAYLLLLDGLAQEGDATAAILRAAAELNSAYAGLFADRPGQARRLHDKALDYALRGVCMESQEGCAARGMPFDAFNRWLAGEGRERVDPLFTLGSAWAGWIQAHSDDWNAVAELSRVQAIMERVAALDNGYRDGSAHLYLGVIGALVPPASGGDPQRARAHFEQAVALSDGRNLMAKVRFAKHYARMVFDRGLHDRLLQEVLAADPRQPGLTLANTLAQREARQLLAGGDDYF